MIVSNKMIKKAFTMAEAVLVMTILGIIATIMIANIKPSEFREEAMQIQAKKVMNEIDEAMNLMVINDTEGGNYFLMYNPNDNTKFCGEGASLDDPASIMGTFQCMQGIFSKYISFSRKPCNSVKCPCFDSTLGLFPAYYLKDGACFGMQSYANVAGFIPGDEAPVTITRSMTYIFFDINGENGPNILGKDQYRIPFYSKGLWFDAEAINGRPNGAKCGHTVECVSGSYCISSNSEVPFNGKPWGVCTSGS